MSRVCHHCGKSNNNAGITFDNLYFCCQGCKAVYRLIHKNELGDFYDLYPNKGNIPSRASNYAFLDDKIFCTSAAHLSTSLSVLLPRFWVAPV